MPTCFDGHWVGCNDAVNVFSSAEYFGAVNRRWEVQGRKRRKIQNWFVLGKRQQVWHFFQWRRIEAIVRWIMIPTDALKIVISLWNSKWPTWLQPIVGHFFMHGVHCSAYFVFRTDGRTDTMCENNDHPFGRGPVGQLHMAVLVTGKWFYFSFNIELLAATICFFPRTY